MPKFNHAFDFAFEVVSEKEDASDVTEQMLLEAILQRVARIANPEKNGDRMLDACQAYDTYNTENHT